jgi:hypothetical protein
MPLHVAARPVLTDELRVTRAQCFTLQQCKVKRLDVFVNLGKVTSSTR